MDAFGRLVDIAPTFFDVYNRTRNGITGLRERFAVPLVFVHRVATRIADDPADGQGIRQRAQLVREMVLRYLDAKVFNPYWGRLGGKPSHQWASLRGSNDQRAEVFAATAPADESHILAPVCKEDFAEAIDLLFGGLFDRFCRQNNAIPADALKATELAAALDNARKEGKIPESAISALLNETLSDTQFAKHLWQELGIPGTVPAANDAATAHETFGVGGVLEGIAAFTKDALGRIREGLSTLLLRNRLRSAIQRIKPFLQYAADVGAFTAFPGPSPSVAGLEPAKRWIANPPSSILFSLRVTPFGFRDAQRPQPESRPTLMAR